jgi:hypothetical protein
LLIVRDSLGVGSTRYDMKRPWRRSITPYGLRLGSLRRLRIGWPFLQLFHEIAIVEMSPLFPLHAHRVLSALSRMLARIGLDHSGIGKIALQAYINMESLIFFRIWLLECLHGATMSSRDSNSPTACHPHAQPAQAS